MALPPRPLLLGAWLLALSPVAWTVSDSSLAEARQRGFISWLKEGGATIHPALSLRQGTGTGVRGLHTDEPLPANTELAYVPRGLWLDDSTAATSTVGPLLAEIRKQTSRLPQHTSLLIFLVHEKLIGAASVWARYFDWLPQSYPDLPTSWSDQRRNAMLAAVPRGIVEWVAHEHWAYGETEFDMLKRIVFDPKPALFPHTQPSTLRDAYNWAYGTIHSRGHSGQHHTVSTKVDGTDLFAVIPFLDAMNHANSAGGVTGDLAQVAVSSDETGGKAAMRLLTNRGYSAGEELHVSYDNTTACHIELLSMYGFTESHERRDCFHLSIHPDEILEQPQGAGEDYRYQLLQQQALAGRYEIAAFGRGRPLMWSLHDNEMPTHALAAIRVLRLPPWDRCSPELLSIVQAGDFDAKNAIDGVDESAVWDALERFVRQSLGVFAEGGQQPPEDPLVQQWVDRAGSSMKQVGKRLMKWIRRHQRKLQGRGTNTKRGKSDL